MRQGTIKALRTESGYGFIEEISGKDYFFHRSGCETPFDNLNLSDRVEFEEEPSPKGPRATAIRVL